MNIFKTITLGCGSAKPSMRHLPSCTVVNHRENLFMIDCGEGAQLSFMKAGLKFTRLSDIFLTHLHGDHVLGLPGLLSTLSMSGTGGKITIHTFPEGKKILSEMINFFCKESSFEIAFNVINPEEAVIFENRSLTVRTIPLVHRVPTVGFVFEEKPNPRHINREMTDYHGIPQFRLNSLRSGEDYVKEDGTVIPNEVLTTAADPSLSYAHISDTRFTPSIAEKIGPVDLLFHETTYLEQDRDKAAGYFHSTASQAATIAKDAGARALLTGHYSQRYRDDSKFLEEAKQVFPNVIFNHEGLTTDIAEVYRIYRRL